MTNTSILRVSSNKEIEQVIIQAHKITHEALKNQHELDKRLAAVEVIVGTIREIARVGEQVRTEYFQQRLAELSSELAKAATHFKNFKVMLGATPDELTNFISNISSTQDAIDAALRGDKGAALRKLYENAPLTPKFDYSVNLGGRPPGMALERIWLAKQAIQWRKVKRGAWWVIGKAIFDEIQAISELQRTSEQIWTLDLLSPYMARNTDGAGYFVTDKAGLSKRISDTVHDYKKMPSKVV